MYEHFRTITQLQSLALTIPLLALCLLVVIEIRKPACETCLNFSKGRKNQMCWILIGLLLAFIGKIVESAWWFIPWTLSYLESPYWQKFNDMGVFVNIIFRQLFFTVSAYCHLRAFIAPDKLTGGIRFTHWILISSFVLGQAYIVFLLKLKPFF